MGGRNCCLKTPTSPSADKIASVSVRRLSQEEHDNQPKYPIDIQLTFPSTAATEVIEKPNPAAPVTCSNGDTLAQGDSSSIMNLYNRYVDCELGFISAEGIERLCNDLQIDPEDFRILVLAYCLGAQVMCRFTEDEFVNGCNKLHITDLDSMKASIPKLVDSVSGDGFPPFYRWTYKFALDPETSQRCIPTDLAINLWKLVFSNDVPVLLDKWLHYLDANSNIKGISKDTWDMFIIFVDQIKGDLSLYDDTEAWPSLLDEFVEHELEQRQK